MFIYTLTGLLVGLLLSRATYMLPLFSRYKEKLSQTQKLLWPDLALVFSLMILYTFFGCRYGLTWRMAFNVLICSLFLLLAVIDVKYRLVPDMMIYPAATVTLIIHALIPNSSLTGPLIGGAIGFIMFFLVALLRPGELGGGDIKLAALIGLVFGFPGVLWALGIGILSGGLVSIFLLTFPKWNKKSIIPYAPFLSIGAIIALLYDPFSPLFLSMIRGGI